MLLVDARASVNFIVSFVCRSFLGNLSCYEALQSLHLCIYYSCLLCEISLCFDR